MFPVMYPTLSQAAAVPLQGAQINLYDPITGRPTATINPVDNTTLHYNYNGVVANITGTRENVQKIKNILDSNTNQNYQNYQNNQNNQNVFQQSYPIDMDINDILVQRMPMSPQQSQQSIQNSSVGWQYIPNPMVSGRSLLVGPTLPGSFSGSGVLFFEIDQNRQDCNLLLTRSQNGAYEDMGDSLNRTAINASSQALEANAWKAVLENSQNLFSIRNISLERQVNGIPSYVDVNDGANGLYRCYIVLLDGLSQYDLSQMFALNRNVIAGKPNYQNAEWRKTTDLKRIPLQNIKAQINANRGINVNDINNISCLVSAKTLNCAKEITQNIFDLASNNIVTLKYTFDNNIFGVTSGLHVFKA